ncbi:hypothetical protein FACS1894137_12620 [Spirochaetia bacterium]|nr:hypothetical protein FACS1894137_12620 [Spirochaetia bacterium]
MHLFDFFSTYLLPNIDLYFKVLLIVALIYLIIYKMFCVNIEDMITLIFPYLGVVFSTAIVTFLFILKIIEYKYFINFLTTTIVFYSIIIFFSNKFKKIYKCRKKEHAYSNGKSVFIFSLLCIIFFIILQYMRIEIIGARTAVTKGSGTGIIIRLLTVFSPIAFFSFLYIMFYGNSKQRIIIFPLFVIPYIYFSLQGISKSAFIGILINLYIFLLLNIGNKKVQVTVKKLTIPLLFFGVLGGIIIVILLTSTGFIQAVSILLQRFVAFGDVYIYAYINKNIDNFEQVSFLKYLFSDGLRTFRLVDISYVNDVEIPGKLMNMVYGAGTTGGPNPRFNIVGYAFFGFFGSILFSVFCAVLFVIVRCIFLGSINGSFQKQLFGFFLFKNLQEIEQAGSAPSQFVATFVLFFIFYCFFDLCINFCKPINKDIFFEKKRIVLCENNT